MIPNELLKKHRWVCAVKDNKAPMQANIAVNASSTNPNTWSSYDDAKAAVDYGTYDYLGYVFDEADGYVGIDIDIGKTDYGLLNDLALDVIRKCKSYTEWSKSKRGVHIILKGTLPFDGKNNKKGMEIYKTGRYFIMTGNTLRYAEIIENQEAIDYVVEKYFAEELKLSCNGISKNFYQFNCEFKDGKVKTSYPEVLSGTRNDSMASLAGMIHSMGFNENVVYEEISMANEHACNPPLDDREITSIVNSITRYTRR